MAVHDKADSYDRAPAGLSVCYAFNLKRAARAVAHFYDEALRPSGLRGTQFSLLMRVRTVEPVTVTRLASAMVMDRTTLARNLRPLERDGLVRVTVGHDRRERYVALTSRGRSILLDAVPLWQGAQERVAQSLGPDLAVRVLEDVARVVAVVT